jgi:imidazolonepropionase-like amidohydrolase
VIRLRHSLLTLLALTLMAAPLLAQSGAPVYAIQGATVHTLAGPAIENGTVVIRDGKIAAVGTGITVPGNAQVIDGTGLHVYPGLFDAFGQLGLREISSVPATNDISELGNYNPQLAAYSAVHPPTEHIPVVRSNGVTHSVTAPGGGVIPGQGTLINHAGWTIEEMAVERSVGMVLNWPNLQTRTFSFATFSFTNRPFAEAKKEYDKKLAELQEWIEAAQHYAQSTNAAPAGMKRNLKLEAMLPIIEGKLPFLVRATSKRAITDAIEFVEKNKLKMVLVSSGGGGFGGGSSREAWKVKDLLAEKKIPVILGPTLALPGTEDEPYDKPFSIPGELHAAGVKIAFASMGVGTQEISRTLPYEAANAVPHGLPQEEALRAITINPAQILGVDDRLGTLEAGKMANLIVTNGDPLEIATEVRHVFINGVDVGTDNKHKQLYEKYRKRP